MGKNSKQISHIFERGDIISNLSKTDVRLVLKAENGIYYFMNLKTQYIDTHSHGRTIEVKGSESSQPSNIVEKHFCLLEI